MHKTLLVLWIVAIVTAALLLRLTAITLGVALSIGVAIAAVLGCIPRAIGKYWLWAFIKSGKREPNG